MKITCPGCQTRYDVAGRPAGTQVSCHCGASFGLPRPPAGPVVLQCPGCGAPSDPAAGRCAYCDTAMMSVCCPRCFAFMDPSDRHCRTCGLAVVAPAVAIHRTGEQTLPCPKCSRALTANLVGDHLLDRCDSCGGIWIHHLAIDGILRDKGHKSSVAQWAQTLPRPARDPALADTPVACPDCEQPLAKRHAGRIVIDVCASHGIWFDHREIRALVGVPAEAADAGSAAPVARRRETARRRKPKRRDSKRRRSLSAALDDLDDWWPWEAIEELLEFFEDLFD